jgi:hypothetical protein
MCGLRWGGVDFDLHLLRVRVATPAETRGNFAPVILLRTAWHVV